MGVDGMSEELVSGLARQAMVTTLLVSAPILALGLITGVVVGIFQAATQIHEQTLAFVPKIVAVMLGVVFLGPWMLRTLVEFTAGLLANLPQWIR